MATSPLQPVEGSKSGLQKGYDDSTGEYHVQFKAGGPVYIYPDVDADTAGAIDSSDDPRKAISAVLVGRDFRKVDPQDEEGEG